MIKLLWYCPSPSYQSRQLKMSRTSSFYKQLKTRASAYSEVRTVITWLSSEGDCKSVWNIDNWYKIEPVPNVSTILQTTTKNHIWILYFDISPLPTLNPSLKCVTSYINQNNLVKSIVKLVSMNILLFFFSLLLEKVWEMCNL